MDEILLKKKILESFTKQGFGVNGEIVPLMNDKGSYKQIHLSSRHEQIILHSNFIRENIKTIKPFLRDGREIDPEKIDLRLIEVERDTLSENIYRWWNFVWWSVPYQRAYGRQLRFIVWDIYHNSPVGLIGLQSPILKMSVRDKYLDIPRDKLDFWINKSMQAQRLGALPPYNDLLTGKLIALSVTSNEVRSVYKEKYARTITLLKERIVDPDLLFITTTSAFGKSSIYNRLKYKNEDVAISLGYTQGSGTFHIPEELYKELLDFLKRKGESISTSFGNGPSRKIKLLDKAFRRLGMGEYTYHNIHREFFLFPLVKNLTHVIQQNKTPFYFHRPLSDLTSFWKDRWCIPRSVRSKTWQEFNAGDYIKNIETYLKNGK